jgi:hypothetical protein
MALNGATKPRLRVRTEGAATIEWVTAPSAFPVPAVMHVDHATSVRSVSLSTLGGPT